MIELPDDFAASERGNTWLTNGEGDHVALIDLPGGDKCLEISMTLDNYPGLLVNIIDRDDAKLAEHINTVLTGWYVRKCNVGGVNVLDGEIAQPE